MDMLTLAIDTSHHVAVGLARGDDFRSAIEMADPRGHVEHLMSCVTRILAKDDLALSDVGRIVVGMGPGPFTGLRVGVVTAWTLAETLGVPWHGVCSLDVIARQWDQATPPPAEFVVASDARRKELYWARYAADGSRLDGPHVSPPQDLAMLPIVGPVPVGAEGLGSEGLGGEALRDRIVAGPRELDPGVMAAVGSALPSAGPEPLYLRRPDATEPGTRKSALPTGPRLLQGLTPRRTRP